VPHCRINRPCLSPYSPLFSCRFLRSVRRPPTLRLAPTAAVPAATGLRIVSSVADRRAHDSSGRRVGALQRWPVGALMDCLHARMAAQRRRRRRRDAPSSVARRRSSINLPLPAAAPVLRESARSKVPAYRSRGVLTEQQLPRPRALMTAAAAGDRK